MPIPHKMCLSVPRGRHGSPDDRWFGFLVDPLLADLPRTEWRVDESGCDCDCTTCQEVHGPDADGRTFYAYRYLPTGRQVAKVTIIADGTEGIA